MKRKNTQQYHLHVTKENVILIKQLLRQDIKHKQLIFHIFCSNIVSTTLAILREQPQRWRFWQFTSTNWQGLQAAISLQDWSSISTASGINSAWELFHRNLLSLMHRFIPSHLQLSYLSSRSWYTESCGEAVVLKRLAFSSWKANPTEGNLRSFHKACSKCVSTLKEPENNMFPISRMTFQTCLPPLKPGGALSSPSLVYAPFPSHPTL